jgi:hypothetical protein
LRDAAQPDRHLTSGWSARIASQSLCPREPIMSALCSGKGRRLDSEAGASGGTDLDHNTLLAYQLDARPPVESTAPVIPEQGSRTDDEWMQQHAHLAGLGGSAAIPLTLLAQRTRTATADAGGIHQAQAPVGLSASFVCRKRLTGWTTQRPIRLEGEILPREATRFPGQGHGGFPVPLNRSSCIGLFLGRRESGSKLGRAHRIRMKCMAHLQTEVPEPLRHDLPCAPFPLPSG